MTKLKGLLFLLFVISFNVHSQSDTVTTKSGLKYISLKDGKGTKNPVAGNKVKVKYSAHYANGKKFQSATFEFIVDKGEVIEAWDEAVKMMTTGEKAYIIAPPSIAFAEEGFKAYEDDDDYMVPPNATLIYYMTLVSFK